MIRMCFLPALSLLAATGCSSSDDIGGGVGSGSTGHTDGSGGAMSALGGGAGSNSGSGGAGAASGSTGSGGDSGGGSGAGTSVGGEPASGGAAAAGGGSGGGEMHDYPLAYQYCVDCHGETAEGVPGEGPNIQRATWEMTQYLVRAGDDNETLTAEGLVVGDPEDMMAFDETIVTDEELLELVAWLQDFPAGTTGAELFAQHCSFCHGDDGRGGDLEYATAYHSAPFVRLDLAGFTDYVKSGHTSENGVEIEPSERRKYMPPFDSLLTDAEIALLYAWTQGQ
jgi:mono/diheme cytochrome c family protein